LAVRTKDSTNYADSLAVLRLRGKDGGDEQVSSLERIPKESIVSGVVPTPAVPQVGMSQSGITPNTRQ